MGWLDILDIDFGVVIVIGIDISVFIVGWFVLVFNVGFVIDEFEIMSVLGVVVLFFFFLLC